MNFVKKIVEGKVDELVHIQFMKFSRGEFKERAILKVKKTKNKYAITSGPEFANEMVLLMAKKLGNKSTKVTGAIVSTSDLKDKVDFVDIKQFQGVKRYLIDKEMTGGEISNLVEKFPKTFFGLSFDVDDNNKLKIKPKAPKSGKPGKGDDEPKADFCKLVTTDIEIGQSFVFEKENFKEAKIKHNIFIDEIIMPEDKDKMTLAEIRETAKRRGRIVRFSDIDGVKDERTYEFVA